jgi:uncharacterized protein YhhL (DUF1145 family)
MNNESKEKGMSVGKIVMLVLYAVLVGLALTQAGAAAGIWAVRILVVLAVVHTIEVLAFFKLCQSAGGSLAGHVVSVFLFGILHAQEIKAAQAGN